MTVPGDTRSFDSHGRNIRLFYNCLKKSRLCTLNANVSSCGALWRRVSAEIFFADLLRRCLDEVEQRDLWPKYETEEVPGSVHSVCLSFFTLLLLLVFPSFGKYSNFAVEERSELFHSLGFGCFSLVSLCLLCNVRAASSLSLRFLSLSYLPRPLSLSLSVKSTVNASRQRVWLSQTTLGEGILGAKPFPNALYISGE